jgi:hypothetical protein
MHSASIFHSQGVGSGCPTIAWEANRSEYLLHDEGHQFEMKVAANRYPVISIKETKNNI